MKKFIPTPSLHNRLISIKCLFILACKSAAVCQPHSQHINHHSGMFPQLWLIAAFNPSLMQLVFWPHMEIIISNYINKRLGQIEVHWCEKTAARTYSGVHVNNILGSDFYILYHLHLVFNSQYKSFMEVKGSQLLSGDGSESFWELQETTEGLKQQQCCNGSEVKYKQTCVKGGIMGARFTQQWTSFPEIQPSSYFLKLFKCAIEILKCCVLRSDQVNIRRMTFRKRVMEKYSTLPTHCDSL